MSILNQYESTDSFMFLLHTVKNVPTLGKMAEWLWRVTQGFCLIQSNWRAFSWALPAGVRIPLLSNLEPCFCWPSTAVME
ncbi:hypothetical protein BAUCODRAFT_399912 [Baudoinia panamericana UAMH 10762]|uniref:Uncharacterized protein n=1 Tax=Baudoinia panamericana (strain UAMH 10762) TaxID=717646 RepID=M2NIX1_BAUPA|nr:uncharacterized protein BAUCODRAFT_399912 [Baudoinia panamericana UAMH 10762]EMC99344.1 hypothetical protein BAUCODRAFT_399912 [Baudoinia panamericana UAMH 10762]